MLFSASIEERCGRNGKKDKKGGRVRVSECVRQRRERGIGGWGGGVENNFGEGNRIHDSQFSSPG